MAEIKSQTIKPRITFLQYRALLNSKIWGDVLAAELNITKDKQHKVEKTKDEWDVCLQQLKNRPAGRVGPVSYKPQKQFRMPWVRGR